MDNWWMDTVFRSECRECYIQMDRAQSEVYETWLLQIACFAAVMVTSGELTLSRQPDHFSIGENCCLSPGWNVKDDPAGLGALTHITLTWHYTFGMGDTSGTIYLAAGAKIWDTRTCPWCLEDQLQIPSSCRNLQLHPTRTKRGRQTNKLLVHRNILIHSMFYTFFTILNYLLHTISMWRLHHTVPWLLHYSEDKHIYRFCSTYTNGSK